LPDFEQRFWQRYKDQGFQMVALNPRESPDQIAQVEAYADALQVTFDVGMESPATTYMGAVENFPGPNPFPVTVIVAKDGTIRWIAHETDADAMTTIIEQALAE
jgi:hypothetical protein